MALRLGLFETHHLLRADSSESVTTLASTARLPPSRRINPLFLVTEIRVLFSRAICLQIAQTCSHVNIIMLSNIYPKRLNAFWINGFKKAMLSRSTSS